MAYETFRGRGGLIAALHRRGLHSRRSTPHWDTGAPQVRRGARPQTVKSAA